MVSWFTRLAGRDCAAGPILRPDPHGGLFFEEVRSDQCDRTEHPGRQTVIWIDCDLSGRGARVMLH